MTKKEKQSNYDKHIVKCPHCGEDVLDHFKECPHCHGELTPAGYGGGKIPLRTQRIIRTVLLAASIAVLLALAFVLPNL